MSWETQGRSRRYCRTRRKPGGGFERQYLGVGPLAELAAAGMNFNKLRRQEGRNAANQEQVDETHAVGLLDQLIEWTNVLFEARAWVGRGRPILRPARKDFADMITSRPVCFTEALNILKQLVPEANAGDVAARADLCQLLDTHAKIWQCVADLAGQTEVALVNLVSGGEQLFTESLVRKLADIKEALGLYEAGPLEQLLIQRLVALWLHVQFCEVALSEAQSKNCKTERRKHLASANQQFLAALNTLLKVRPRVGCSVEAVRTTVFAWGKNDAQ